MSGATSAAAWTRRMSASSGLAWAASQVRNAVRVRLIATVVLLAAGATFITLSGSTTSAGASPETYGYVRYGPEGGPTSTVPGITYRNEDDDCDGPSTYQPPTGADESQVEAYVCVEDLFP